MRAVIDSLRTARYLGRELMGYAGYYIKRNAETQVRVFIFGQGRTGSTVLENLLASTGHFIEHRELLNARYREVALPLPFILGLSRWRARNFVCHVKLYHLLRDRRKLVEPARFLSALHEHGWKIIYLRRQNKVEHVLSSLIAEQRGAYQKKDDSKEALALRIDCRQLVKFVRQRMDFETLEKAALDGLDYHEVIYERDLKNPAMHQTTVDGILDYLSLPHREARTQYKKIKVFETRQLISNYDDAIECLRRENWAHFLEDPWNG